MRSSSHTSSPTARSFGNRYGGERIGEVVRVVAGKIHHPVALWRPAPISSRLDFSGFWILENSHAGMNVRAWFDGLNQRSQPMARRFVDLILGASGLDNAACSRRIFGTRVGFAGFLHRMVFPPRGMTSRPFASLQRGAAVPPGASVTQGFSSRKIEGTMNEQRVSLQSTKPRTLSLEDVCAFRATAKLIGGKPASNAANRGSDPESIDRPKWSTDNAYFSPDVCSCAPTGGSGNTASHQALRVVVGEIVFALRTHDVGHKFPEFGRFTNFPQEKQARRCLAHYPSSTFLRWLWYHEGIVGATAGGVPTHKMVASVTHYSTDEILFCARGVWIGKRP